MLRSLQVLHETRKACGVDSQFVFAIPGYKDSRIYHYQAMQRVARAAGMRQPHLLTTTRLRKHHATMAQVYYICSKLSILLITQQF